jgi:hypothetical protein
MKDYTVYFEIFNKKLKTTIRAESKEAAKESIKNRIVFHRVEKKPDDGLDKIMGVFGDIFK